MYELTGYICAAVTIASLIFLASVIRPSIAGGINNTGDFIVRHPRKFKAKLEAGPVHVFRGMRIGHPKVGELYLGGNNCVWIQPNNEWPKDLELLIVELVD